ncbi:MAG: peptidylprolyl isomerase [Bacteroidota bacterium]
MNKITLSLLTLVVSANSLFAQNLSDTTLLTINDENVKVSEFVEVYEKNLDLVQDPEQKKIDNYLPLFTAYKAKLIQARELGLDTLKIYQDELEGYRKDLAAPYFKDPKEEELLLKEAYERSKYDLNVSHILLLLKEDASDSDTLKAYKKLISIRKEIETGKISFADAAKKYSEGPSAKTNGELSWMSVFRMVYPFESGAYNTQVGEVSMPVRSSFGYHLIKVNDKRPSKGKVQIAHVIKLNAREGNKDSVDVANKELIDTVYAQLLEGKEFEMMARQYSDDKRSAMNGGVLPVLGAGQLLPEMEKEAFTLGEGEISKPFKTKFGWHIVKVLKKFPVGSYEDSKEELSKKLAKDNRSMYIEKSVLDHLHTKYTVEENNKLFEAVEKEIGADYLNRNWKYSGSGKSGYVLNIEGRKISASDYIEYLEKNPVNGRNKYSLDYVITNKRKAFIDSELLSYYDDNLEKEFPEFKAVMTNYREGILIYNLMNQKIWEKSQTDSLGLAKYYDDNKEKYLWPERADLVLVKCFEKKNADKVRKYLKRGKSQEYIKKKLNKDSQVGVTFQSGLVTSENEILPENFEWKEGVSKIYKKGERDYVIIDIKQFVKPQIKTLEEAENNVRSDYQVYLENLWKEELINSYKVIVDENVLSELRKKYNQ